MKVVIAMVMVSTMAIASCSWVMVVQPMSGEIVEIYVCSD